MNIHLVEDANYARQMIADHLTDLGHRVSVSRTPGDLLENLSLMPSAPDLVIADLPADPHAVTVALRLTHRRYPTVPVVLRVSREVLPTSDAVHCGVIGYLSKPFRQAELELMLIRLAERASSQSLQDEDSGVYGRVGFAALARQQLKAAERTKTEMLLLRVDVDGSTAGGSERAIAEVGRVVRSTCRDADMAGRVNGTDCGVLLVNVSDECADIAVGRLQQSLADHNEMVGEARQIRTRIGRAGFDPSRPCTFEDLVAEADAGLPSDSP